MQKTEREPVVQEKLEGEKEVEVEGGRWQRTEGFRYPGGIGLGEGIEKVAPKEAEGEPHHTEAQEPARAPTASGGRLSSVAWDHFQPIIVEIRVIIRTEGQNLKTKE